MEAKAAKQQLVLVKQTAKAAYKAKLKVGAMSCFVFLPCRLEAMILNNGLQNSD